MGLTVVVGDAEGMGLLYAADAYTVMRHPSLFSARRFFTEERKKEGNQFPFFLPFFCKDRRSPLNNDG